MRIETPHQETYYFPCNNWLDKKEDDGSIERILYPDDDQSHIRDSSRESHRSHRSDDYFDVDRSKSPRRNEADALYIIQICTSDIDNADTDAKVYIQISGTKQKTDRIFLSRSKTNRVPFLKGQSDTFELYLPELGEIRKIRYRKASYFFIAFVSIIGKCCTNFEIELDIIILDDRLPGT